MAHVPGQPSPEEAAANAAAAAHATVSHEPPGHGPAGVELGPLDVPAWAAGFLGVLMGIAVLLALFLAGRPA